MANINTNRLEIGMEIKNYKELCKLLKLKVKNGNAKIAQLKEMKRFFEYNKSGHCFIIEKIYNKKEVKEKIELRGSKIKISLNNLSNYKLDRLLDINELNINEISLTSNKLLKWKCIDCESVFIQSPSNINKSNHVKCDLCSQSKDAKIIQKALNYFEIEYQKEYSFDDLISNYSNLKLRFDFALFKNEKLITLLECDRGYYDFMEKVVVNDNLKNKYCDDKDINLIRIHHTDNVLNCLLDYFIQYDFITCNQKEEYLTIIKLSKIKNKISKLKEEEMQLELKLKEIKVNEY